MNNSKVFIFTFSVFLILIPAGVEAHRHVCTGTARNAPSTDPSFSHYATCVMVGDVSGTIYLRQGASGTEFRYKLKGLSSTENSHESDVHEFGNLFTKTADDLCKATGESYNVSRSFPENICVDGAGGMGNDVVVVDLVELEGNNSIVGRSIVVYAAEHDHDHDDDDDDDDDDHEMIGCCVIGISDEWLPENIEASIPIKLKLKSEEDKSGVNGKGIAWVVLGFGFFWKIFQ